MTQRRHFERPPKYLQKHVIYDKNAILLKDPPLPKKTKYHKIILKTKPKTVLNVNQDNVRMA